MESPILSMICRGSSLPLFLFNTNFFELYLSSMSEWLQFLKAEFQYFKLLLLARMRFWWVKAGYNIKASNYHCDDKVWNAMEPNVKRSDCGMDFKNYFSASWLARYWDTPSALGFMLFFPGLHPAGHTSPCSSVNWKACNREDLIAYWLGLKAAVTG